MKPPPPSFPAGRRELWAWCCYDFANSSFSTLIVTVAYSVYFIQIVATDLSSGGTAERLWFWGYSASMLVVAVLSPILGALADARAIKRQLLIFSTLLCVVCTALLFFVVKGDTGLGLVLFGLANIGFDLGFVFCSAFLVELVPAQQMGRLSGYGWGFGYVGGLLSLALAYPFIKEGFVEANLTSYRLSFVVTAVFFLVAALPTFAWLQERAKPRGFAPGLTLWRELTTQLRETIGELARYRDLRRYFVAYLIYTDAINTVIVASAIFANKVLDFTPGDLIIYFLVTQITAGLGSVGFGLVADRIGAVRAITITLVMWVGLVVAAALVQTHTQFYLLGLVAGAALGSNQAVSRTLIGRFTPLGRQGEFFGFFSVVGKFAAIMGPIVYGEVTAWTGSQRWAVLSMAVFFVAGLAVFLGVDERRGIAAAQE
ncbi:MFS transporter [Nitrospira sp. NS4]|uniref:MFS transporter n=1 Tax=Nitrospira sp. NS4 TaxID=3414498 RepID=UPI003C2EAA73